jgi:hypothetical protein
MVRRLVAILTTLALVQLSLTGSDAACAGHEGIAAEIAAMEDGGTADHGFSRAGVHDAGLRGPSSPDEGCAPQSTPASCLAMPACAAVALSAKDWAATAAAPNVLAVFPAAPLAPLSPVRAPELPPPRA